MKLASFTFYLLVCLLLAGSCTEMYRISNSAVLFSGETITTFAGLSTVSGSADGTGTDARFNSPVGIIIDSQGNLYVSESGNHTIRKVTPTGVVTTYAGQAGTSGFLNGSTSVAEFSMPLGIVLDSLDNLYIADQANDCIRKITSSGIVSTFAGLAGSDGATDGTGSSARFTSPYGLAIDSTDQIIVADTGNYSIRKITPNSEVTTFAGMAASPGSNDGTGVAARFQSPTAVVVDQLGNIYVSDYNDHTIRKIGPTGVVTTIAGLAGSAGSTDGAGALARFNRPVGLAIDHDGTLYIADTFNHTIRKMTPDGVVSTFAGSPLDAGSSDGSLSSARFNYPIGIAIDHSRNALYVLEMGNHTIRKIQ